MDMEILYNDKSIIVCVKPVGLLSQADSGGRANMVDELSRLCESEIFPLHRLDRDVGGVMVFAKTKMAAAKLSQDIAEHRFVKKYYALVHGCPKEKSGEMRDWLFKDSLKNKSYVVKNKRKGVKEAFLEYSVLNTSETEQASLVEVVLHTGRTHQIRVQFASRKMPLFGDRKYGGKDNISGIGLWSYQISLKHPQTGEMLTFCSKPENYISDFL